MIFFSTLSSFSSARVCEFSDLFHINSYILSLPLTVYILHKYLRVQFKYLKWVRIFVAYKYVLCGVLCNNRFRNITFLLNMPTWKFQHKIEPVGLWIGYGFCYIHIDWNMKCETFVQNLFSKFIMYQSKKSYHTNNFKRYIFNGWKICFVFCVHVYQPEQFCSSISEYKNFITMYLFYNLRHWIHLLIVSISMNHILCNMN